MDVQGLSVVIPAYNEEENIEQTLLDVTQYLKKKNYPWEVIVVDDGSRDATPEKIQRLASSERGIRFICQPENHGKGEAVKKGILEAKNGHCLFMDADNATSIREWDEFEKRFHEGSRVVIASRHLPGSNVVFPQPWSRRFLGSGYRILCRLMFGLKSSDFNCGFKAYETALAQRIYSQNRMNDWTFDIETLYRLKKEGLAITEVPVRWTHRQKKSSLAPTSTALKTLVSLWQLKRKLS